MKPTLLIALIVALLAVSLPASGQAVFPGAAPPWPRLCAVISRTSGSGSVNAATSAETTPGAA